MPNNHGFTLVETLITTAILVTGLVAVASIFSYSVTTNIDNRQRTAATLLLADKMEQFKATSLTDSMWTVGGSLNPENPGDNYFDYVTIGSDGALAAATTSTDAPYFRMWKVEGGGGPRTVTVIVYAQRASAKRQRMELIRATTKVSETF